MKISDAKKHDVVRFKDGSTALVVSPYPLPGRSTVVAYFNEKNLITHFKRFEWSRSDLEVVVIGKGKQEPSVTWTRIPSRLEAIMDFERRAKYDPDGVEGFKCRFPSSYVRVHCFFEELTDTEKALTSVNEVDCYWKVGNKGDESAFFVQVIGKGSFNLPNGFYFLGGDDPSPRYKLLAKVEETEITKEVFERALSKLAEYPIDRIYGCRQFPIGWTPLEQLEPIEELLPDPVEPDEDGEVPCECVGFQHDDDCPNHVCCL
jgi:hypothetical protein